MRQQDQGIIIGIEAAIDGGSLSLYVNGMELDAFVGDTGVSRAEELLPSIDDLLRRNDLSREHIGRVVVSSGPGSFTGIRIGIATAMGLADGLGCPLVGISSLTALAFSAGPDTSVLSAIPVGRDLVCVQHFYKSAHELKRVSDPQLLSEEEFSQELTGKMETAVLCEQLYRRLPSAKTAGAVNTGGNIASMLIRGDLEGYSSENLIPTFIDRRPPAMLG